MDEHVRVVVDGRVFHGPWSGTATYAGRLVAHLAAHPRIARVDVVTYPADPRGPMPSGAFHADAVAVRPLGRLRGRVPGLIDRAGLPVPFDRIVPGGDVYLFPNYRSLPLSRGVRGVAAVYDLAAFDVPEHVPERHAAHVRRATATALERCDVVLTCSQTSAAAIRSRFPEARAEVVVVTPGPSVPPSTRRHVPDGPVIVVGTVEPRKNLAVVLEAYTSLPQVIRARHRLVVVGKRGWAPPELFARLDALADQGVEWRGYVSEAELVDLRATAVAHVAPSSYEGFDMPLLDSLAAGIPVIASDIPVHREVAGDAALWFPPDDAGRLAGHLADVLADSGLRERLSARSTARGARFSWSDQLDALVSATGVMA